uniref:Uncharacterized protein n=1 Tax=viral metagenome TaxID=1070528 RepID=A0A6M3KG57_9ZZZZ
MQSLPKAWRDTGFGTLNPQKGVDKDNQQISVWDALPECLMDECPSFRLCAHGQANKRHPPDGSTVFLCSVMKNYLVSITSIIMKNCKLDEMEMMRVGYHLIPMYKNLCRLLIQEVGVRNVTTTGKFGVTFIHPIYDIILKHIQAIDRMWNIMKLKKGRKPVMNPEDLPSVDDLINGDPDYYESLQEEDNEN